MLFQAGRGDFIEKYIEIYAHWVARGWRVSGFDWRGQGGSGRFHPDPLVGHAPSLDPLVEDLDRFVTEWRREQAGPHVLVGHSMGAHLILRLLAERRIMIDAAVLSAPMLELNSGSLSPRVAAAVARAVCLLGFRSRLAWREGDRPTRLGISRQTNLTSCAERYADEAWWKEQEPKLAMAAPSWGWLSAAFRSTAQLERPGVLEGITTPILILMASKDRLVRAEAIRRAAARLPDARLIESHRAAHELLREIDAIRVPLLEAIDRFLDEKAPPA